MEIIRKGRKIKLTKREVFNAYLEQENLFDIENIKNNMDTYLEEEELKKLKNNRAFIEEAALELRRNQDKYGMAYEYAISDAFKDTKQRYLRAQSEK